VLAVVGVKGIGRSVVGAGVLGVISSDGWGAGAGVGVGVGVAAGAEDFSSIGGVGRDFSGVEIFSDSIGGAVGVEPGAVV